ncbi:fibronectin type III domain-containing protein [bacterium]|nr:fibronectin type III domain-containing protein [bacterium]
MKWMCLVLALFFLVVSVEAQTPRYKVYSAPFPQLGGDGAEPSIGVNGTTGKVLFQSGLETLRVTFDDATSPAQTTWVITPTLLTSLFSLDPVLFTDKATNRTFVSQLDGGCSLTEYTDNDGASWNLSIGCGVPAGLDHQSIGGGPYTAQAPQHSAYPNSVFYCSQNLVTAVCSRSDDGGFTFGLGVPVYTLLQCGGRHGRVKAAPNGIVYLPNSACGLVQGLAVSENNGSTWTVRTIPGSTKGQSDPSIGIGSNGRLYFGYQNGDGRARVAVSTDQGKTWIYNVDVGASLGIMNSVFPAMVAGDDGRAAFAFLGTTTAGDYQKSSFTGTWHLYISTTFNGGKTWTTVNTTAPDPVQFGSINIQDGVQPAGRRITANMATSLVDRGDRNLLDFIDIAVDKLGRVLVAYADGCVDACASAPSSSQSRSARAAIARQSGGKRLYAAYDPVEPAKPAAPLLSGKRETSGVVLNWSQPDNGGSSITKYKIYRRTGTTSYALYKTLKANSYVDTAISNSVTYYYRVSALNSKGEGPQSNEVGF